MTAGEEGQALAEACAGAMWADDRASLGLGMELDQIGPGRARMSMRVGDAMVNGLGICHGGFIFTLADSAMAYASNSHGEPAVAQQATIAFLRPARRGDLLTAEATERVVEGRTGLYDVRVTAEDGAVLAEFRGHSRTLGTKILGGGG